MPRKKSVLADKLATGLDRIVSRAGGRRYRSIFGETMPRAREWEGLASDWEPKRHDSTRRRYSRRFYLATALSRLFQVFLPSVAKTDSELHRFTFLDRSHAYGFFPSRITSRIIEERENGKRYCQVVQRRQGRSGRTDRSRLGVCLLPCEHRRTDAFGGAR